MSVSVSSQSVSSECVWLLLLQLALLLALALALASSSIEPRSDACHDPSYECLRFAFALRFSSLYRIGVALVDMEARRVSASTSEAWLMGE